MRAGRGGRHGGVAVYTGSLESGDVVGPERVLILSEEVQVVPAVDPAVMAIGKSRLDGVVADLHHTNNFYRALARLQRLLPRPMSAYLGRRRIHPQQLIGEPVLRAVFIAQLEHTRELVQNNGLGPVGARNGR